MCSQEQSLQDRRKKYLAIKDLLDQQVRERENAKHAEDVSRQHETSKLVQHWQTQEAAEEAAAQEERLHQQVIYDEMLADNRWLSSDSSKQLFRSSERCYIVLSNNCFAMMSGLQSIVFQP